MARQWSRRYRRQLPKSAACSQIHIDFGELQRLRGEGKGNLIIIGHLAGDSLGFTPFLAALRRRGLEVTTFSGVIEPNP